MNIKKTLITAGAGALLFGSLAISAFAVGSNGSFEGSYTGQTFDTLTAVDNSIPGWTVDTGSVDWIGNYWVASDAQRSLDLNGLTTGSVSQTLTTIVGATYNVHFDLSGNPDNSTDESLASPSLKTVRVTATGAAFQDFSFDTTVHNNTLGNMMWEPHTYSFVASSTSSVLTFASQIPGAFGPALDNVVIEEITPTPTPTNTPTPTPGKDQCKKDGWKSFGTLFKNQGDCVSFFATGGKNLPAGL